MKSLLLTILGIYSAFLAGFGAFYVYNKYYVPPVPPYIPQPNNQKNQLDLVDFDVLLVTTEAPKKLFHINYVDNAGESYQLAHLDYSLDGKTLKSKDIPFANINWKHITTNKSNSEFSVSGSFEADGINYSFEVPSVKLGMVIRAEPTTGKYGGSTNGPTATIISNKNAQTAYAGITAGFFTDYPKVSLSSLQVNTDWFMYFDNDWSFYHLDNTKVKNPTPEYYSHEFFSRIMGSSDVTYYKLNSSTYNSPSSLSINYNHQGAEIENNYELLSPVIPFSYAKTYLITQNNGDIGIYTKINSFLSK